MPSPAAHQCVAQAAVVLQHGGAVGSTSPGPHSVQEQIARLHWNGDKATDSISLSSLQAYSWTKARACGQEPFL